ncbi:MAG: hypothetical protein K0Q66_1498 [Chitinophagaceae bacterium]|jgi:membrane protein YdbS with pleckstrin-like domain|nr:hypothetical protein [Chitinophagaceae bacterium]
MQFQNLQVLWDQLPKAASAQLKPIEKEYLKVLYISWAITYGILLAVAITLVLLVDDIDRGVWLPVSIGVILVAVIITFIIGTASFRRKAYAVREKDILFQTGWIFRKFHVVPFNRVQHCLVQSGPIGRRYGLSSLSIYTAASNASDISIRGLKHEDAETLKAYILQQIQPLH